jgi:hypothetical protein
MLSSSIKNVKSRLYYKAISINNWTNGEAMLDMGCARVEKIIMPIHHKVIKEIHPVADHI